MDILTIVLVIVIVLIVLGMLVDKIQWMAGVKMIVVVAVLGLLLWFVLGKLGN